MASTLDRRSVPQAPVPVPGDRAGAQEWASQPSISRPALAPLLAWADTDCCRSVSVLLLLLVFRLKRETVTRFVVAMPIGKVASRDLAPRAGNALASYVMAEQFATPDSLLRQVRACKLQEAFRRDRVALAQTLEEVLQYHIAQREGVGEHTRAHSARRHARHTTMRSCRAAAQFVCAILCHLAPTSVSQLRDHSILRQRRSEEMAKAVALFEREVWVGAFLPKWERIVAEVAKRKRLRARRKNVKMEEDGDMENEAAEETAPVAVAVAVAASARPVAATAAAAAAAPAPVPLPPAMTLPPPQHPLVWDTSIRGRFTPASGRMLKQWFVDHIQVGFCTLGTGREPCTRAQGIGESLALAVLLLFTALT